MLAFVAWLGCACVLARLFVRRRDLVPRSRANHAALAVGLAVAAVLVGPPALVLQKIIARIAMPAAWPWDVAWVVFVVGVARMRRRWIALAGAAGIVLTLIGSEAVGLALNKWLERDFETDPFAQGSFDAVFVLGGGVDTAPHGSYELGASGDRVAVATRLYHRGLAKHLVISGSVIEGLDETFDNVRATSMVLHDLGVPDDAVVKQAGSTRNTREEAAAGAKLVAERGWTRIGLVTSAWHMRRALALFRRAGLDPAPLPADHRGELRWNGLYDLVPRDSGYYLVSKACWEVLGSLVGF